MCERNLGWRSGRFLGRSPARLALKAIRWIARWADLWRERLRHSGAGRLVAVLTVIALSPNSATAQDPGMPINPIWGSAKNATNSSTMSHHGPRRYRAVPLAAVLSALPAPPDSTL